MGLFAISHCELCHQFSPSTKCRAFQKARHLLPLRISLFETPGLVFQVFLWHLTDNHWVTRGGFKKKFANAFTLGNKIGVG
jgi:hypothetical protein